jgi:hypothetical protein
MLRLALPIFILLISLFKISMPAFGIGIDIVWHVPIDPRLSYRLEIAKDSGFVEIVHQNSVRGQNLRWETEVEGVYHWRLVRESPPGTERNTFLSGSFAAIDQSLVRQKRALLTWDPVAGAEKYKLYVLENQNRRVMLAHSSRLTIPESNHSMMIEVIPYTKGTKTFDFFHFNPSLRLDSGMADQGQGFKKPLPVESSEKKVEVVSKVSKAPVAKPAPQTEVMDDEEPPPFDQGAGEDQEQEQQQQQEITYVKGIKPVHLVNGRLYVVRETIRAQKLEIDLSSEKSNAGLGFDLFTRPVGGFMVTAIGEYHEHAAIVATKKGSSDFSQTATISAARFNLSLGLGFDLLTSLATEHHLLALSLTSALTQVPLLPKEYSGADGASPFIKNEKLNPLGVEVAYSFFASGYSLSMTYQNLQSLGFEPYTARLSRVLAVIRKTIGQNVNLEAGTSYRKTSVTLCHKDAAICLREGKVQTAIRESSLFVAFGMVFF